jgi:hypothetical protein
MFEVTQHAGSPGERLFGSWKIHKPILQDPAMRTDHLYNGGRVWGRDGSDCAAVPPANQALRPI